MLEFTTSFNWQASRVSGVNYIRLDDLLIATVRHKAACKEHNGAPELIRFLEQFECLLQNTKDRLNE